MTSVAVSSFMRQPPWRAWRCCRRGHCPKSRAAADVKRTAVDQVTLGKTGIKLSRLGIGTGSDNGNIQTAGGKGAFVDLIHYAYDRGITYIDTAESYNTFGLIGDAIKGLPREKLFIQSKVDGRPDDVLAVIDHHRKTFNTDYVDSLLVHCMTRGAWTDQWKRVMDGFDKARKENGSGPRAFPAIHCLHCAPPLPMTGRKCIWCASTRRALTRMARWRTGAKGSGTTFPR